MVNAEGLPHILRLVTQFAAVHAQKRKLTEGGIVYLSGKNLPCEAEQFVQILHDLIRTFRVCGNLRLDHFGHKAVKSASEADLRVRLGNKKIFS